jgi:hypothetical protein
VFGGLVGRGALGKDQADDGAAGRARFDRELAAEFGGALASAQPSGLASLARNLAVSVLPPRENYRFPDPFLDAAKQT